MSEQHYIIGYGSLMSHDSRYIHSHIDAPAFPVWVEGWERGWVTSCPRERFNSVGAYPKQNAKLNAALVPVESISTELQQRENNYRFTEVLSGSLLFYRNDIPQTARKNKFWICETLNQSQPDIHHPMLQTYIDTCLIGCIENADFPFARHFIESTQYWFSSNSSSKTWINDRAAPLYPRAARLSDKQQSIVDTLLDEFDLIQYRTSPSHQNKT